MVNRRVAFTIIELLIVISIIVILVGLLMAGAQAVRKARIKSTSEVIVGMVATALAAAEGERKSLPIVPHPLASTRNGTLLDFKRGAIDPIRLQEKFKSARNGGPVSVALWSMSSENADFTVGKSVLPVSISILGGENVMINAGWGDERLLANDVLADINAITAVGAKRELLGVLGVLDSNIHEHIRCPTVDKIEQRNITTGSIVLSSVITDPFFDRFRVTPSLSFSSSGWVDDQEQAVKRALESSWAELGKVGGIRKSSGYSAWNNRYVYDTSVNFETSKYTPGSLKVATKYKTFSLHGISVIDGWGVELFISKTANGRVRVISAGKDGCLRINPGTNGVIDTIFSRNFRGAKESDSAGSLMDGLDGDDKNGVADNISSGTEPRDYVDLLTDAEW